MRGSIWKKHLRFSLRSNLMISLTQDSLSRSYWASSANSPRRLTAALLFHQHHAGVHLRVTRSVTKRRGGISPSFLSSSTVSFAFAGRHTVCGYTERMGEKERFKISDGRSVWRYRYFAAWSACPASARSPAGPGSWFSVNPVGHRLRDYKRSRRWTPRVEETIGKADTGVFRKARPPVGEKAHIYRSRFPETWVAVFSEDLRRVCITKRTQHRRIFRGCADVCFTAVLLG